MQNVMYNSFFFKEDRRMAVFFLHHTLIFMGTEGQGS